MLATATRKPSVRNSNQDGTQKLPHRCSVFTRDARPRRLQPTTRGMLFEALLPPADRRLQALLACDLAELLALGRVGHRREAEHFLAIL